MRVFVAGGSGVLGQRLVSQLVARGHQVTATTTSEARLGILAELGAQPVVMDGLDGIRVGEAVAMARPDAIVHQMSAMPGGPGMKHVDRWFIQTNRLRTEGTDHLLAAAEATGVSHVVARSHVSRTDIRSRGWVKISESAADRARAAAIRHVEDAVVEAGGAALRYGRLYGPGIIDDQVEVIRTWQFSLVGGKTGHSSRVHLDDAASATVLAVERKANGVFDIVDDEPAEAGDWLPYLAQRAGAQRPRRVPTWLARLLAGPGSKAMMAERRGCSNAKARRELGWQPRHPSWRQGLTEEPA